MYPASLPSPDRRARAVLTQSVIAEIARLPERAQITERFGADRIARIEERLSIAWVPLDEHLELVELLYAAIGVEGYVRFWRKVMTETLGAPLVAGLVRMSTKDGPMRLLSRGQMVHEALTRGTGVLAVEDQAETSCVITLRDFPARDFSLASYADGIAGSILGACDRSGVLPSVSTEILSAVRGDVRYEVAWQPLARGDSLVGEGVE